MLTDKDLYCIAMTVQAEKFTVYAAVDGIAEQSFALCKYKGECFKFGKAGSIKKIQSRLRRCDAKLARRDGCISWVLGKELRA